VEEKGLLPLPVPEICALDPVIEEAAEQCPFPFSVAKALPLQPWALSSLALRAAKMR
jgi:hypothetical protein